MATSGTYTFNPSLGETVLYAFQRAGLRSAELTLEHMVSARNAANYLLIDWSNDGPGLWQIDLVTVPLVGGQPTYPVGPETVMILDAYIHQDGTADRVIMPVSRTEYASYPNKDQLGPPSVYWFDRQISPTVTLWPVPGLVLPGVNRSLQYYRVKRAQDAEYFAGMTVDIIWRFLSAFAEGLAYKLAGIWNPERAALIGPDAERSYKLARKQDVENAQFYISPILSGYWRN